jgi:hypothetical protein
MTDGYRFAKKLHIQIKKTNHAVKSSNQNQQSNCRKRKTMKNHFRK